MSLRILAVGMLDYKTTGVEQFFVQTGEDEVMLFETSTKGTVRPVVNEPAPLRFVTASIEKFNHMYRVTQPVELESLEALPSFMGRFRILNATACELLPT